MRPNSRNRSNSLFFIFYFSKQFSFHDQKLCRWM